MTKPTSKSIGHFMSLKLSVMEAKLALYQRRVDAEDQGDFALAASFVDARKALDEATDEIAKAEAAFLFSDTEVDKLVPALEQSASRAKKARKRMDELKTALQGAADMIGILTQLAKFLL